MEPQDLNRMTAFEYSQWIYSQQAKYGNCHPPKQPDPDKAIANAFKAAKKVRGSRAFAG